MKKILFVLGIAALIGCEKNKTDFTIVEILATDIETGLPIDSVNYYVTHDNYAEGYQHASAVTRHGHCQITFDAEKHLNYYWFAENMENYLNLEDQLYDYNKLRKGEVNKIDLAYAQPATLQLGYENVVNYGTANTRLVYRITSQNHSAAPQAEHSWNNYYSGLSNITNPSFAFYDLAALEYLVEWKVFDGTGVLLGSSSELISLVANTPNYYNLQY